MATDARDEDEEASAASVRPDPEGASALGGTPQGARIGVAAWGLVVFFGCRLIEIFLEAQSTAALVGQTVLVEWATSRLGIAWTASSAPGSTSVGAIVKRALPAAATGLAMAGSLVAVLLATRGLETSWVGNVEISVLVVGLFTAGLTAWRDELLLHGLTLRVLEPTSLPTMGRVVGCGLTSAGAALGRSDATPRTVFLALLLGVIFGALWIRDEGAWRPWAAHTTFRFATGTLVSGGLVHGRIAEDRWAGGAAGILGGTAAVVALAPFAIAALIRIARTTSPHDAKLR